MKAPRSTLIVASTIVFGVLGLARPGDCALYYVDFEQFGGDWPGPTDNPGAPIPESARLYDQLLGSHGLIFTSGSSYVSVINYYRCIASGTKGIEGSTADGKWSYSSAYPVVITFFKPGDMSVPAATDFVSIQGDLCGDGNPITVEAYDVNGNLVASSTGPDSGEVLSVSTDRKVIHQVMLLGHPYDYEGVVWDNLTFNSPVPLPSGAQKADLVPCPINYPSGTTPPSGGGFVVFNGSGGPENLEMTLALKGVEPDTDYDIWLGIDTWGTPGKVGTVTTNRQGNANFHLNTAVTPGTHTLNVDVTLTGSGSDVYELPGIHDSPMGGVTMNFE